MAQQIPADDDTRKLYIGSATSELCFQMWRRRFFDALIRFWNENTGEQWVPDPERNRSTYEHPQILEVGWWLHSRAMLSRDPNYKWDSRFGPDVKPPYLLLDDGRHDLVSLSDKDLAAIEEDAHFTWARNGRARLAANLADGSITLQEASETADRNGWPAIPPRLALDSCRLPKQEWITLGEAIGALILGQPCDIRRAHDLRLTDDAEELATEKLLEAVYSGHVHLYGTKSGETESERIDAKLFLKRDENSIKRVLPWNEVTIEGKGVWKDVFVKVDTMREWLKKEAAAMKKKTAPSKHVMSPGEKDRQIDAALVVLQEIYKELNEPRKEELDRDDINQALGKDVAREVIRAAREKLFKPRGLKPRLGRRRNERPTAN
jgi:hypothetical protein